MRRGLVIGKFMPVHKGHLALIDFALTQCDELIVSMSYTVKDPILKELHICFGWRLIFRNKRGLVIKIHVSSKRKLGLL